MTDPKAAAERIVEWADKRSFGPLTDFDKDAATVARAYLSLTADKGAEERAREIVTCWVYDDDASVKTDSECAPLIVRITAALTATAAAAEARERERAAEIAQGYCDENAEAREQSHNIAPNSYGAGYDAGYCEAAESIAAAIRGGDNG